MLKDNGENIGAIETQITGGASDIGQASEMRLSVVKPWNFYCRQKIRKLCPLNREFAKSKNLIGKCFADNIFVGVQTSADPSLIYLSLERRKEKYTGTLFSKKLKEELEVELGRF